MLASVETYTALASGRHQMREALSGKGHAARPDKTASVIASGSWVSLRYVGTRLCDLAILN